MADFRKEALTKTLREDFGITTAEQLLRAIGSMTKLDITQFVLRPDTERKENYGIQHSVPNLSVAARA